MKKSAVSIVWKVISCASLLLITTACSAENSDSKTSDTLLTNTFAIAKTERKKEKKSLFSLNGISASIGSSGSNYQGSDNPYVNPGDMKVNTQTDYSHVSESTITQGNNETFTIRVYPKNKETTPDDLVLLYEDGVFTELKTDYNNSGSTPYIEYVICCNKVGYQDLYLLSLYDYYEYGDEAPVYYFKVHKLDQREGTLVWISYSGEKYHKTEAHAGSSPTSTTLYDVESLEMDPCQTCY